MIKKGSFVKVLDSDEIYKVIEFKPRNDFKRDGLEPDRPTLIGNGVLLQEDEGRVSYWLEMDIEEVLTITDWP